MDYYNRLCKNSLVDRDAKNKDFENGQWLGDSCILCGGQKFASCKGCRMVSCQGNIEAYCSGYAMDGLETCVVHPDVSYCRACRELSGPKEILTQCPSCEDWHCRQDQSWCDGHPLSTSVDVRAPSPSTTDATEPKKEPKPKPELQHPPRAAPCRACIDGDEDAELMEFRTCANRGCWSSGNKVCEDCAPEGGMGCSNYHKWYCDDCAAAESFDEIRLCPGCGLLFCHQCSGIERCFGCGASSLCRKCADTVSNTKESTNKGAGAQLEMECAGCGSKLCRECETQRFIAECENCTEGVCQECADVDQCCECKSKMCTVCSEKNCNSCDGMGESRRDEITSP
jgi:hypothetical protein